MNKNDYKIIVYSLGFTITDKKLLLIKLTKDFINEGVIKKSSDITNYTKYKLDGYSKIISMYDIKKFNLFVIELLEYIDNNFEQEDYYHLSFDILNKFIIGINNFDEKFNNKGFIKILKNLYNDIIQYSQLDFVKSYAGEGLLIEINKLKEIIK